MIAYAEKSAYCGLFGQIVVEMRGIAPLSLRISTLGTAKVCVTRARFSKRKSYIDRISAYGCESRSMGS